MHRERNNGRIPCLLRRQAQLLLAALSLFCSAMGSGCATHARVPPDCRAGCRDHGPPDTEFYAAPDESFRIRLPVRSWRALQRENIVLQKYDYSCGAASLATMFQYYFEDDVPEKEVLKTIFLRLARSDDPKAELKDRIKNGFSLLDLLNAAKDLGYLGAVVKIPLSKLAESQAPVILRIEKLKYEHFVVFRGIHDNTVYLADPVRGNIRLSTQEFLKQWSGESLFLGKAGFGLPKDYPLALRVVGPARPELEVARQALLH